MGGNQSHRYTGTSEYTAGNHQQGQPSQGGILWEGISLTGTQEHLSILLVTINKDIQVRGGDIMGGNQSHRYTGTSEYTAGNHQQGHPSQGGGDIMGGNQSHRYTGTSEYTAGNHQQGQRENII